MDWRRLYVIIIESALTILHAFYHRSVVNISFVFVVSRQVSNKREHHSTGATRTENTMAEDNPHTTRHNDCLLGVLLLASINLTSDGSL